MEEDGGVELLEADLWQAGDAARNALREAEARVDELDEALGDAEDARRLWLFEAGALGSEPGRQVSAVEAEPEEVAARQVAHRADDGGVGVAAGEASQPARQVAAGKQRAGLLADQALDLVGDGDDAAGQRYLLAAEPVRVTAAVPVLVMGRDRADRGLGQRQVLGRAGAENDVVGDPVGDEAGRAARDAEGRFLGGERRNRCEDEPLVAEREAGELGAGGNDADVVKKGRVSAGETVAAGEAEGAGEREGDVGDALSVARIAPFGEVDRPAQRDQQVR